MQDFSCYIPLTIENLNAATRGFHLTTDRSTDNAAKDWDFQPLLQPQYFQSRVVEFDQSLAAYSEIFSRLEVGRFHFHDFIHSRKQDMTLRQIKITAIDDIYV